jgi:hypothetical protein
MMKPNAIRTSAIALALAHGLPLAAQAQDRRQVNEPVLVVAGVQ